jgi:hypothetical protein
MIEKHKNFWAHLAVAVVALMLAFASLAVAQSDRGTITGTVTDPTGAMVPGASVVLTNIGTQTKVTTATTSTGNFTIASVPAGMYELAVTATGFSKAVQTGVQVQVALTNRVDVVLQVGATTESVTVTAEGALLRTENAELSTNVKSDVINALPINVASTEYIRDPYAFITLSPGVTGNAEGATINGFGSGNFRVLVEGQDGTSANNPGLVNETQPSVESIGEFTLQTSNFAAEYGQALSAVVNFTVHSGTNGLHGSLYEYLSNEALNAHTAFTHVRGASRVNNPGFSVGGPVIIPKVYNGKDKTFFYWSWEFFRCKVLGADVGGNTLRTMPTDAYRRGDFSAALTGRVLSPATNAIGMQINENVIYDPATDRTVNGNVIRDPFFNNIIPTNRLDPVALKIQGYMPAPTFPNLLVNNWQMTAPDERQSQIPTIKIDHSVTDTARLSFYWNYTGTNRVSSNDSLPAPITARRNQNVYAHTVRLNYDQALTPTFLIHLGSGYVRYLNPDSSPDSVLHFDAAGILGFTGAPQNGMPQVNGISNGNFGGYSAIGLGPANANKYYSDKWTSVASATWVRGNHTIKTGGELKIDSWEDINSRGATGILNFSSATTGLPAVSTANINLGGGSIGLGYASFLLGLADNGSVNSPQAPQWRKTGWGLYLQDTWKATRKLTLDYGLRWDLQGQGHEIWYRWSQFGPTTPNPSAGGLPGAVVYPGYGPGRCNCNFASAYPYAIGPRIGAAYQVTPKTVVRLGWGITYSTLPSYSYITNNPLLGVGYDQYVFSTPAAGQAAIVLKNGLSSLYNLPSLSVPTYNPGIRPTAGQLNAPNSNIDPNGSRPTRVNQWNIAIQRELVRNLVVEGAYVGNRAIWVTANSMVSMNLLSDARLAAFGLDRTNAADQSLLTSTITSAAAVARGFTKPYASFPSTATVAQAIRPFPQYSSSLNPIWAPVGDSWYDSLQLKATKRFSHGLQATAAYTFQKQLAINGASNDMFNRVNQKRPNGPPQVFIASFTYVVPRYKGNKWVARVTGDWTLGGVMQYTSGNYLGIPSSNNRLSNQIFQGTRWNRVEGQPLYLQDLGGHAIDPYQNLTLNPAAWVDALPGQWGYSAAAYSDYRGVRSANEQFNFGRTFRIREKMSFEIRGELFNAFNRINWAGPSTGNPAASVTRNSAGQLTGGFGYISASSSGNSPRNGQLVARFTF